MRRSYRQDRFLGIIDRVRAAMPEAAITTDIIVGFPGETEADFQQTLDVVEAARFAGAFTFQYSKRPGTPAATLPDQVPKAVVQERYQRLAALANDVAWAESKRLVGRTVELMVAEGEGRKDPATHRLSGRARDNRLVHFAAVGPDGRPGRRTPGRRGARSRSPTPHPTTWSPTAPSAPYGGPGRVTRGRPAPPSAASAPGRPGCRWGCPRSACPHRSRRRRGCGCDLHDPGGLRFRRPRRTGRDASASEADREERGRPARS